MGGEERRWYTAVGVIGHAARGVIFLLAGFFVVRAAWEYDPKEAIGLDGALAKLAHAEYGPFLLGAAGGPVRVRALLPRPGAVPRGVSARIRCFHAFGDRLCSANSLREARRRPGLVPGA